MCVCVCVCVCVQILLFLQVCYKLWTPTNYSQQFRSCQVSEVQMTECRATKSRTA